MASNLHHVRDNFAFRLEAISPTFTQVDRGFLLVDEIRFATNADPPHLYGNSTGRARDFTVRRASFSRPSERGNLQTLRAGRNLYELRIGYPTAIGPEIHEMIDKDADDVIQALDISTAFVGTRKNPTQATGLNTRHLKGDVKVDTSRAVWVVTYPWDCYVTEILV